MTIVMALLTIVTLEMNIPDVFVDNTAGAMEIIVKEHWPEKVDHFVKSNPHKTKQLARYFVEASMLTGLPIEFLLANAWRESKFKQSTEGAIGEAGIMQIHGTAINYCRQNLGRKVRVKKSARDNILCGAKWLEYAIDQCDGNYRSGIHKYMSGRYCKVPKGWKLYKRANIRMELMDEFEDYVMTGNDDGR